VLRIYREAVEDRLKACSPGAAAKARVRGGKPSSIFGSTLNANLHFHCATTV
jgi:hypothetical protein